MCGKSKTKANEYWNNIKTLEISLHVTSLDQKCASICDMKDKFHMEE